MASVDTRVAVLALIISSAACCLATLAIVIRLYLWRQQWVAVNSTQQQEQKPVEVALAERLANSAVRAAASAVDSARAQRDR